MKNIASCFFSLLLGGMLLAPMSMNAQGAQGPDLTIDTNLSGLSVGKTLVIPYTLTNAPGAFVAVTPVGELVATVNNVSQEITVTSVGQTVKDAKLLVSVCNANGSVTYVLDEDGLTGGGGAVVDEFPITIEGATLTPGMPAAATSQLVDEGGTISMNDNIIAGGSNPITISSPEELETIDLAVDGEDGYYSLNAADYKVDDNLRSGLHLYRVNLQASLHITVNINIRIIVVTIGGDRWGYDRDVTYIPTGTGDLKVSLTFDNAKDVDLWVKEPNGNFIYYANRRPYLPGGAEVGLDLDSNAGCNIDNVNNENIFFDEACLQKGTYEVYVQMYSNCDPTIATPWILNVYYKGEMVQTVTGSNPATGVFPVDTPSKGNELGDPVMTFTINEGQVVPVPRSTSIPIEANPTESAKIKLRQLGLID